MSGAAAGLTPEPILQLGLGFWGSKTLLSAVELGLFTELAEPGRSTRRRCAERLELHPRERRGLPRRAGGARACSSARTGATRTRPRPTSSSTARSRPTSAASSRWRTPGSIRFWGTLTEALRTGEPQNEAKQRRRLLRALYADPRGLAQFLRRHDRPQPPGRRGDRREVPLGRPQDLDRHRHRRRAASPVQVALAHPHLTGGGFDLPAVEPVFNDYVAQHRPRRPAALHRRRLLRRPAAARPTCS